MPEGELLENLARTQLDGDGVPDTTGISVFVTAAFYISPCYLSFVSARADRALKKACEAATGADKCAILEPLRGLDGLPEGMSDTVECAINLFDETLTLPVVVRYMSANQPQAVKLALDWTGASDATSGTTDAATDDATKTAVIGVADNR